MPSTGPTAWRLNKAELAQVETGLSLWEVSCDPDLSEEAKVVAMDDERRRLTREIQQVKHNRSLEKQQTAASGKRKTGKQSALVAPKEAVAETTGSTSNVNGEYFQKVNEDLAVIFKVLGARLKDKTPTPIAATSGETTGVQDSFFSEIISANVY